MNSGTVRMSLDSRYHPYTSTYQPRSICKNGKDSFPVRRMPNQSITADGEVTQEDKVVLPRFLGLIQSMSFILGLIIGTGIFLTPTGVLRGSSGSVGVSLIMWVVGAFMASTGAMCMTEMAIYFRRSGGPYIFLSSVYGPAVGFVKVFVSFFVYAPCSSAIQSFAIVNFLTTPFAGTCGSVPELGTKIGASCVFLLAVAINSTSTRGAANVQVFMLLIKTGTVIAIISMGVSKIIQSGTRNFQKPFETSSGEFDVSKLPSAFFSASFAYGGWDYISNITEEVKRPAKTIVRAMAISFIFVTVLYLLTNIAYFAVLTTDEIMSSDAVAALFAVRVVGKRWSFIIWLCVVLSAAGNLNGATYTSSRVFFTAARTRQFPFILSTIHVRRKTPVAAIIVSAPITLLVIYYTNIWTIIDFLYCFAQIENILTMAIVPYLRWKKPERVLAYKAPLWSCVIFIAFTVVVLVMAAYSNPIQIGITVAIICLALAYNWVVHLFNKSDRYQAQLKHASDFIQKLLLSVEQEMKTY